MINNSDTMLSCTSSVEIYGLSEVFAACYNEMVTVAYGGLEMRLIVKVVQTKYTKILELKKISRIKNTEEMKWKL